MAPRMNINSPVGHLTMADRFEQAIITLSGGSILGPVSQVWLLWGLAQPVAGQHRGLLEVPGLCCFPVFTELEGDHT